MSDKNQNISSTFPNPLDSIKDNPSIHVPSVGWDPKELVVSSDHYRPLVVSDPSKDLTKPNHYKGKGNVDLIDFALMYDLGPLEFNIFKYLIRKGKKPGVKVMDDMRKAKEYFDRLFAHYEKLEGNG